MKQQAEKGTTSQYTWLHITQPSRPQTQPAWPLVCTGHTTKTLPLQGSYCRIYSKISIMLLTPKNKHLCKTYTAAFAAGSMPCHPGRNQHSALQLLCLCQNSTTHSLARSLTHSASPMVCRPSICDAMYFTRKARLGCRLRLQTDSLKSEIQPRNSLQEALCATKQHADTHNKYKRGLVQLAVGFSTHD